MSLCRFEIYNRRLSPIPTRREDREQWTVSFSQLSGKQNYFAASYSVTSLPPFLTISLQYRSWSTKGRKIERENWLIVDCPWRCSRAKEGPPARSSTSERVNEASHVNSRLRYRQPWHRIAYFQRADPRRLNHGEGRERSSARHAQSRELGRNGSSRLFSRPLSDDHHHHHRHHHRQLPHRSYALSALTSSSIACEPSRRKYAFTQATDLLWAGCYFDSLVPTCGRRATSEIDHPEVSVAPPLCLRTRSSIRSKTSLTRCSGRPLRPN